ncbi:MAG: transporter substrate-binding domain-containing protein [Oscillospiraceae bacterium]|nr:transporter substrate-binding domain-containing protein [Oscillospiraceae bacterium]
MKKFIALLLAMLMVMSLVACGAQEEVVEDVTEEVVEETTEEVTEETEETEEPAIESDLAYITENGKMLVGITIYEPMNYYDEAGELTGFDTEFAQAVCDKMGLAAEFVEINWDTKEVELAAKSIDCIWNGMTITEDRLAAMSISDPYVKNAQVIVVKADSELAATADLVGKTVVAEMGSAGEAQITGEDANADLAQAEYVGLAKQTDCLMEIKAGTADAAVLDWTLAKSMVGEGTDFADLAIMEGVELATEEYGIAFRQGSDVTAAVNAAIAELVADGTLPALAEKYGLALAPAIAG